MFKLSARMILPAMLLMTGGAGAQTQHVVKTDAPAALYMKCTTVGSEEYDSNQCNSFRAAADKEIAACMSGGAANSHGYRALRLRCAEALARRFTESAD